MDGVEGPRHGIRKYFFFIKEKVSTDWKDLAYQLGFGQADINNIVSRNQDDKSCCRDLLEEWLNGKGERATIEVLMEALSEVELQSIVDKLKIRYPELAVQIQTVGADQAQTESMKAPEGLKALETTNDSVKLGWTEVSSTQADGYRLEKTFAFEENWASAQGDRKLLPATITEFTVVDLTPYREYHFCVRSAMDRMGKLVLSERSVPLYVVTKTQYQPYRPRNIKLTDRTHAPLSLTWKEPSPAADVNPACYEYIVEMCAHCKDKSLNIWAEYCRTTKCHCSINVQDNGIYRFRVSVNNTENDVTSLPEEMGDPDIPIHIKTNSEWLIEVLKTFWPFSATTQPRSQESGSIVFNISCHDLEGLRELWMNYKLGKVKKFFGNFFARLARLASVEADTELEIRIDKEDFYSCRRHLLLTRPTSKGFRLVRLGEGDSRGIRLGLSEDFPVYCKPISHKTTCSQLDFLDPAIPKDQLGLDHTNADDKLFALGREKSHQLEVQLHAVRAELETERQETKALRKWVRKMTEGENKAQKIILEQKIEIEGMQTARQQTEALVLNLAREVTREREEKEKTQKMLQEQKIAIKQLQEINKSIVATFTEELMVAKHSAKGESKGLDHGRKGDLEKETYSSGEAGPKKKEESRKRSTRLGLSEDYPVYCKPISHKTTCSQLDFLDPAIPVDQLVRREERRVSQLAEYGAIRERTVDVTGVLLNYCYRMRETSQIFCQDISELLLNPIRKRVESPPTGYNFIQLRKELRHARQQYEELARGSQKSAVLQEMTKTCEQLESDFKRVEEHHMKLMLARQKANKAERRAKDRDEELQQLRQQAQDMPRAQREILQKLEEEHKKILEEVGQEAMEQREQRYQELQEELLEEIIKMKMEEILSDLNLEMQMMMQQLEIDINKRRLESLREAIDRPPPPADDGCIIS